VAADVRVPLRREHDALNPTQPHALGRVRLGLDGPGGQPEINPAMVVPTAITAVPVLLPTLKEQPLVSRVCRVQLVLSSLRKLADSAAAHSVDDAAVRVDPDHAA
jgi:hypothetical protein